MNQEKSTSKTKLCPVCGTRLSETAKRCLVCGSQLEANAEAKSQTGIKAHRLPELRLSLPLALGLIALIIALVAVVVYFATQAKEPAPEAVAPEFTATLTPTETMTPTITNTPTPEPTFTPLPPNEYTVVAGDTCLPIAALFGVSIQSIIQANDLNADCDISPGTVLLIPQPTPTASPQPTATLNEQQSTDTACQVLEYKVQANDTLSTIADLYNVSMASIREYSEMINDTVYEGLYIKIPLCERKPTAGPTPTPTPLPPYPAPNLLLPVDGAPFSLSNDAITLQWAAVAELKVNEYYAITVEDLTSAEKKMIVEYVTDTKFILPISFRPADTVPHIMRWWVSVVRQTNEGTETPVYEQAGLLSEKRVFSWTAINLQSTPVP
jgi:LysM repeat protein